MSSVVHTSAIRSFSIVLLLVVITCSTSPTGRSQVTFMSDEEMNQMGAEAFEDIKTKTPIESAPGPNTYVRCITSALLEVTQDDTGVAAWEVVVFRDNTANAFALPGGKIGVHTGILPIARSADQLAAVLGHEIGHVIARHGNERVSQAAGLNAAMGVLGAVVENETVLGAMGAGAQYGVLLPFGREHETEADIIGQQIMAKAGFNPEAAMKLWENMAAAGGESPPEIMSTHPAHDTRIKGLRDNLPNVLPLYAQARAAGKNPNCRL